MVVCSSRRFGQESCMQAQESRRIIELLKLHVKEIPDPDLT